MATMEDLRRRTVDLFRVRAAEPERVEDVAEAPARAREDLRPTVVPGPEARPSFSEFDPDDMRRVRELFYDFGRAKEEGGAEETDRLGRMLDAADERIREENPALVQWALRLFITHDPEARRLPIPSTVSVNPQALAPSRMRDEAEAAPADPEAALAWYREDPGANMHHEHWHAVYPWSLADRTNRDREGELFLYMHEQMLARYDTERHSVELPAVAPLDHYAEAIEGGYDPGPHLIDLSVTPQRRYSARPPDGRMSAADVQTLTTWRQDIENALGAGKFDGPAGPDELGTYIEASTKSPWAVDHHEMLHNWGHVALARIITGPGSGHGVVYSVRTAIRDPVFYRWHRHIDDFSHQLQGRLAKNDPGADAPPVTIRASLDGGAAGDGSPDVILGFMKDVAPAGGEFDGAAWAAATFGEDTWGTSFADTELPGGGRTRSELLTRMGTTTIRFDDGTDVDADILLHEPFFYVFRLENTGDSPRPVTLRVFLCASDMTHDRRMWIEMDKFALDEPLPPGKHAVFRAGADSSVIRRSAMPPEPIEQTGEEGGDWCQCGWPYNLLLPRGTAGGMRFQLMVMATDNDLDTGGHGDHCETGSMSYCGMQDGGYPDRRGMGYPFDRDLTAGAHVDVLPGLHNVGMREITIRCENL